MTTRLARGGDSGLELVPVETAADRQFLSGEISAHDYVAANRASVARDPGPAARHRSRPAIRLTPALVFFWMACGACFAVMAVGLFLTGEPSSGLLVTLLTLLQGVLYAALRLFVTR